jgi:hypothetical protein
MRSSWARPAPWNGHSPASPPLRRWTHDHRDDFIRIVPEIVTGRRILSPGPVHQ